MPVAFGAIVAFILFVELMLPIRSTDLWWHLVFGRHFLGAGTLVMDHSIFTWTSATSVHPFYNSWLGDVFLYLVDRYLGIKGLIGLRYLVFFGIFALAVHFAYKRKIIRHPLTWVILLVSFQFMRISGSLIKPELLSLGMMSITAWLFFYMRFRSNNLYLPYLFPVVFVLWANIHGAFFVSSLFLASAFLGEILNSKFSPHQAMPWAMRKHFFIALFLSACSILINPYGYQLPFHIIQDVVINQDTYMLSRISAYVPTFNFNSPPYYLLDFLILAMLIFVLLVWQKLKQRSPDWVVILAFIAYAILFIQINRVTYFLGPVFLFICLDLLAMKKQSWLWRKTPILNHTISMSSLVAISTIGWATASNFQCGAKSLPEKFTRMLDIKTQTVQKEADYIERNIDWKKIGNIYKDGGYLLYRFWPDMQVAIDPRYFPFKSWIKSYFEFADDGKNIENFINENQADFWVIRYEKIKPFQWLASSPEWRLAFLGPTAGVFVPSSHKVEVTELSPAIFDIREKNALALIFINALELNNLDLAQKLATAAEKNLDMQCSINGVFVAEQNRAIEGYREMNNGRYLDAAEKLSRPSVFFKTYKKASAAYLALAEQSWEMGDFKNARKWAIEAYNVLPDKSSVSIYNLIVSDWHYRNTNVDTPDKAEEGILYWGSLVDGFLKNNDLSSNGLGYAIETIQAMQSGTYTGGAKLISPASTLL